MATHKTKKKRGYVERNSLDIGRPNLRKARLDRGLTLEEVGVATFYTYGAIQHAELGYEYNADTKASRAFWQKMSEFYDIPVERLKEPKLWKE